MRVLKLLEEVVSGSATHGSRLWPWRLEWLRARSALLREAAYAVHVNFTVGKHCGVNEE